jgi:transposase
MLDTELLPKPKLEPVQRLEVFTGPGRRRGRTAEQKARIFAESYEGSESVSAVARRHGLTPQQLSAWRRQSEASTNAVAFAPVVVTAPVGAEQPQRTAVRGARMIEVVIGARRCAYRWVSRTLSWCGSCSPFCCVSD